MPERRQFRAPGRVNLIGGQVDYHEGWVVSMAIDRDVVVAIAPRDDGRVVARSADLDGIVDIAADGSDDPRAVQPAWGRAVAGVARVLAELGRTARRRRPRRSSSTVPIGAGLSSSAAFEVAVALALARRRRLRAPGRASSRSRRSDAEHVATGVPCGIQDQLTSVFGRAGHAVLHRLPHARRSSRSRSRRRSACSSCTRACRARSKAARTRSGGPRASRSRRSSGCRVLRDATLEQVARRAAWPPRRDRDGARRARSRDALRAGDARRARSADAREPRVVTRRHGGVDPGARRARRVRSSRRARYGARLTGAGFGGCVVALVPVAAADEIAARAVAEYRARTGREPTAWNVAASDGAGAVDARGPVNSREPPHPSG